MKPTCDVFRAEDFKNIHHAHPKEWSSVAAQIANALLLERSTMVYRPIDLSGIGWTPEQTDQDTHSALLLAVTPIAKPDSAEFILRDLVKAYEIAHDVPGSGLGYREFYERARRLMDGKKD